MVRKRTVSLPLPPVGAEAVCACACAFACALIFVPLIIREHCWDLGLGLDVQLSTDILCIVCALVVSFSLLAPCVVGSIHSVQ